MTNETICRPHFDWIRKEAAGLPRVYLIQDPTQLNMTSHAHYEGLSPIGRGEMLGLHQKNVLAVNPVPRRPLGLMYQRHPRRPHRDPEHTRADKRRVPLPERESYWWAEAVCSIGTPPPGGLLGPRRRSRGRPPRVVRRVPSAAYRLANRAANDRRVQTPTGEESLMVHVRRLLGMAQRELTVKNKSKGGTRQVKLQVVAGLVPLRPSKGEPKHRWPALISFRVVRV